MLSIQKTALLLTLLLLALPSLAVPNSKLIKMSEKLDKTEAAEKREKEEEERKRQEAEAAASSAQHSSCVATLKRESWADTSSKTSGGSYAFRCNGKFFHIGLYNGALTAYHDGILDNSYTSKDSVESFARKTCAKFFC